MGKSKNVIVFNGSPNKKGQTMNLVEEIIGQIDEEINVEVIHIFDYDFKPCNDCGLCRRKYDCSIKDGFDVILKKILQADFYIVGSPMWFGTLSGPLLSFFSRLQIISTGIIFRKDITHEWTKSGIFLMTAGNKWHSMMKNPETTVEFLFSHLDASILDFVYATNTDVLPSSNNRQVLSRCTEVAKRINAWFDDKTQGNYYKYGYNSVNYIYEGIDNNEDE